MGFFDRYPYTNWHNVNLDWVLERVKEWGQMVEANDQAFKDLEEANASFKEYVTNYLQDLDIQAQIDDKLDRMFESGVLGEYLQPYVSPVVSTWLDANITEPTGVIIDSSLTVPGACADSKIVGDRLNKADTSIDSLTESVRTGVLTNAIKDALLACFDNVAYKNNDGDFYYRMLEKVLYSSGYITYDYITYDYELGERVTNAIITDVAMSSNYILETEFSFTNDGSGDVIKTENVMGSRVGTGGFKQFALFVNRTTLKCGYWYDNTDTTNEFNYSQGRNNVIVQPVGVSNIYPDNATIKINGTEYNTGSTARNITWSPWLSFFGYGTGPNEAGSPSNKYHLKLGKTKIKDLNGNVLYDFIPAYNGEYYGLYEQINNKFYIGQEPNHFKCWYW